MPDPTVGTIANELSSLLSELGAQYGALLPLLAAKSPKEQISREDSLPVSLSSLRASARQARYPEVIGTCRLLRLAIERVDRTLAAHVLAELDGSSATLSRATGKLLHTYQELARGYVALCQMHHGLLGESSDWSPAGELINTGMEALHEGLWTKLSGTFEQIASALTDDSDARLANNDNTGSSPASATSPDAFGPNSDWLQIYGSEM